MVDIETLGKKVDSTIIQIAAASFNIETGEILNIFNQKADIARNKELVVDGDTLKWWLNTDKELLSKILNAGELSSRDVLEEFRNWLVTGVPLGSDLKDLYLWGNGILFDNRMIKYQLEAIGWKYPIYYRNDRDFKTLLDLAAKKLKITEEELKDKLKRIDLVKHDAFDDVRQQISTACECYKVLVS